MTIQRFRCGLGKEHAVPSPGEEDSQGGRLSEPTEKVTPEGLEVRVQGSPPPLRVHARIHSNVFRPGWAGEVKEWVGFSGFVL